jgi:putative oxidoreductase
VSQLLGRLLKSPIFVISGYAKLADHTSTVAMINSEWAPLPCMSMALSIVAELGGDPLLLFGLFTRPAAVVLGVWCVAAAVVAHSNWVDLKMKIHYLKNLAMARGFAHLTAFDAGAYNLDAVLSHRRVATQH